MIYRALNNFQLTCGHILGSYKRERLETIPFGGMTTRVRFYSSTQFRFDVSSYSSLTFGSAFSSDNYKYLCTINASDPGLQIRLSRQKNRNGRTFYKLKFDVVISFSLTEMKAQIAWRENVRIFLFFD